MGHRAILARERANGSYDLYYSHWGGADLSLARDVDGDPWTHPRVDPDPLAVDVPWADLLAAHLDPLCHEALFVFPAEGPAKAYRPLTAGPLDCPPAVVAVDPSDDWDDTFVTELYAGAREALVAAFESGHLDAATAGDLLRRTVEDCVGEREVHWLDGGAP